jgi:general stress protein 26
MKTLKLNYYITLLFLLNLKSFSQNIVQHDSIRTQLASVARTIITNASICTLITLNEDGLPMARAMDPFLPEEDFTVWFGTNPFSRKVKQIKNNPTVTLFYLDKDESGYVVIHGTAELVDDSNEKETHWKDAWNAFYHNRDNDYILIKVSPKWMEVLSTTYGITGDPKTWETPTVIFD